MKLKGIDGPLFHPTTFLTSSLKPRLQPEEGRRASAMDARTQLNPVDMSLLLHAASEFASYPGVHTDTSTKELLDRFPLQSILLALKEEADTVEVESILVTCLEKIFKTKYGASFIPQYMAFVQAGFKAKSEMVRCLACKAVSCLLENIDEDGSTAVQLIIDYSIYPHLVNCLVNGNELVATATTDAVKNLIKCPGGIGIIFPTDVDEITHLKNIVARCSSTARIRVLALIVKLFSTSSSVASAIYNSNLISLFEAEVNNTNDILMCLSAFELFYELIESPYGTEFPLRTKFLQLLASTISNTSLESVLRSRVISITGKLLSSDDMIVAVDPSSIKNVIQAIDGRLDSLENQDTDEQESALEASGEIGSSTQGAGLLLSNQLPLARQVVEASFDGQGRGKQLAALHALANICGETRPEDKKLLNVDAEECLRQLIYKTAAKSSKLAPSGLFLSVLRQDSDIRLAAYRMISGLVARSWCLLEVCSKQDMIDIVTSPHMETTKNGMEARYNCCMAINKSLFAFNKINDAAFSGIASKLQEALRRGPYLAKERPEAQPVVAADRL